MTAKRTDPRSLTASLTLLQGHVGEVRIRVEDKPSRPVSLAPFEHDPRTSGLESLHPSVDDHLGESRPPLLVCVLHHHEKEDHSALRRSDDLGLRERRGRDHLGGGGASARAGSAHRVQALDAAHGHRVADREDGGCRQRDEPLLPLEHCRINRDRNRAEQCAQQQRQEHHRKGHAPDHRPRRANGPCVEDRSGGHEEHGTGHDCSRCAGDCDGPSHAGFLGKQRQQM